jgi:hypothetical protein
LKKEISKDHVFDDEETIHPEINDATMLQIDEK